MRPRASLSTLSWRLERAPKESMAIFATSGKSSKKTTPRGSGGIFSSNSQQQQHQQQHQQQQQQQQQQTYTVPVQRSLSNGSFNATAFAPEKTGDSISPGLRLSSMETSSNKPPTGRYAGKGCLLDQVRQSMIRIDHFFCTYTRTTLDRLGWVRFSAATAAPATVERERGENR